MPKHYDSKEQVAPKFKIRDLVLLNTRNNKTQRPTKKLDQKRVGLFIICKFIETKACKLWLPQVMKLHTVFHVSLFDAYQQSQVTRSDVIHPDLQEIEGVVADKEFEVQEILGKQEVEEGGV